MLVSPIVIIKGDPTMVAPVPILLISPKIWKYELSFEPLTSTTTYCISYAIILPTVTFILDVVLISVYSSLVVPPVWFA